MRIHHAFPFKIITGLTNLIEFKSGAKIPVYEQYLPFTGRILFQGIFSLSPFHPVLPTLFNYSSS